MTYQTPQEFGAAFDSKFRRSAFRLELLDRYVTANEAEPLRRFRSGEPQDPSWREPWTQYVRAALCAGKQMTHVHVVDEPLSEYLKFELTCGYPASVAVGEDVRILLRHLWPSSLWLSDRDYWLFDDREAVVMIYDETGNFLGAETTSAPVEVERYGQARDHLMQYSMQLGRLRLEPDDGTAQYG